jgi:hypothetical protein
MLLAHCDKCGGRCEGINSNTRRHTTIAYMPDGSPLGIELIPLFNGQVNSSNHICNICFSEMLSNIARTELEPQLIVKLKQFEDEAKKSKQELDASLRELENEKLKSANIKSQNARLKSDLENQEKVISKSWEEQFKKVKNQAETAIERVKMQAAEVLRIELIKQESVLAADWTAKIHHLSKNRA